MKERPPVVPAHLWVLLNCSGGIVAVARTRAGLGLASSVCSCHGVMRPVPFLSAPKKGRQPNIASRAAAARARLEAGRAGRDGV